jgi:hypothetical protein
MKALNWMAFSQPASSVQQNYSTLMDERGHGLAWSNYVELESTNMICSSRGKREN